MAGRVQLDGAFKGQGRGQFGNFGCYGSIERGGRGTGLDGYVGSANGLKEIWSFGDMGWARLGFQLGLGSNSWLVLGFRAFSFVGNLVFRVLVRMVSAVGIKGWIWLLDEPDVLEKRFGHLNDGFQRRLACGEMGFYYSGYDAKVVW